MRIVWADMNLTQALAPLRFPMTGDVCLLHSGSTALLFERIYKTGLYRLRPQVARGLQHGNQDPLLVAPHAQKGVYQVEAAPSGEV